MAPRQYLIISEKISGNALLNAAHDKIATFDIAAILLEGAHKDDLAQKITTLQPICHEKNIALLIKDRFELVKELGLDGVHITKDETLLKQARGQLGKDFIVGAEAGLSRHRAMLMGEMGAEYIAFSGGTDSEIIDMCNWWTPLFQIPCIGFFNGENEANNISANIDFYSLRLGA